MPELTASVADTPGIRLPGAIDPHEMAFRALIGHALTEQLSDPGQPAVERLRGLAEVLGEMAVDPALSDLTDFIHRRRCGREPSESSAKSPPG